MKKNSYVITRGYMTRKLGSIELKIPIINKYVDPVSSL